MENKLIENQTEVLNSNSSVVLGASLRDSSEDVLVSVAVLGLIATVADGEPHAREIDQFTQVFVERFSLSKPKALKVLGIAVRRMQQGNAEEVLNATCDNLNANLSNEQKMTLFDGLADVIVADGVVHRSEEHFMDLIAEKLSLEEALSARFPLDKEEV